MADVEKTDKSTKNTTVIIFVVVGIFLILYLVYCFEAYQRGLFPFQDFVQNVPDGAVRPLGDPSPVTTDDLDVAQETLKQVYQDYCTFYASVADQIKLPNGQQLVECTSS